ncbi:PREDICTED: uncharacterized protein LOC104575253 [Tinamus guttatus]|uniref:uncharacterized protein LOC104575253 n=1 Tax=Tinamus guttatus TaxID=94827 RepID=UPI00052F3184|nr:PREDICTED: uncharacterized protein LOC104575253 [Tinamus guttatus]
MGLFFLCKKFLFLGIYFGGRFVNTNATCAADDVLSSSYICCSRCVCCRRGRLEGTCAAGYFCLAGSSQATPQGHVFSWRFLSECRWGKLCAGLCPAGFYCQEGSEVPIPCPANTLRSIPGAKQREDCLPCPPGRWCKAGESEAYPCPSGHYCFGGNGTEDSPAPQKCPPHTYREDPGAQSVADCQPCPPGYQCPFAGLTNFEDHPCPLGYWCPGKGDAFLCPPGTSRIQPGAASLEDCDPCSPGYYCPDPAQTGLPNTQGVPCKAGYECPPGLAHTVLLAQLCLRRALVGITVQKDHQPTIALSSCVCFPTTVPQAVPIHWSVKEDTWRSVCLVQGIPLRNFAGSVTQAPIAMTLSSQPHVSPVQQASSARRAVRATSSSRVPEATTALPWCLPRWPVPPGPTGAAALRSVSRSARPVLRAPSITFPLSLPVSPVAALLPLHPVSHWF